MDTVLLCKLFIGKNATFIPVFRKCTTEQTVHILWYWVAIPFALSLLFIGTYLFLLYLCYKCLINRYFDKHSRKHALITSCGAVVVTFSIWSGLLLSTYGFEPDMYTLLAAPMLFFLDAFWLTRLRIRPTFARNTVAPIAAILFSSVLFPLLLHFFPQRVYCECTTFSLLWMGGLYLMFVAYFTIFVFSVTSFWATLTAEELYLFENCNAIAYLTKKCGFWVKVELPAADEPEQ